MRYYKSSFRRIAAASKREAAEQALFLVSDIGNKFDKNAVMLHDGTNKLGHVAATEAAQIRRILDQETTNEGQDQVIVVYLPEIKNDGNFEWSTSFNVTATGIVYERLARKFGQSMKEN